MKTKDMNKDNVSKNSLAPAQVVNKIKDDSDIMKNLFNLTEPVCFVEFKLVPNCDIYGVYDNAPMMFIDNFVEHTTAASA